MLTKMADSKGRVVLGPQFANKLVMIEQVDETEVRVTAAAVIPEREAWLHTNTAALSAVKNGLNQAREGQLSDSPPDLSADNEWNS